MSQAYKAIAAQLAHRPRQTSGDPRSRWAAVAVILAPDPLSVLLIRRAERAGDPWSGHVAVPGGSREPGDTDLVETAMRETMEEVGIGLDRSMLLGALDDVAPSSLVLQPMAVRPFVFGLPQRAEARPNAEVAGVFWELVDGLLRPEAQSEYTLTTSSIARTFPAFQTSAGTLWGMTERILEHLLELLHSAS